ncbi:heavy metal-binding domain-containing protein [Pseudomonas sp. PCH446]
MSTADDGAKKERPALYWFDPMYPTQHFNAPGKSPFMDMQLVPKYVDGAQDASSVSVSPQLAQNLGMRTAVVVRERLPGGLDAVGSLATTSAISPTCRPVRRVLSSGSMIAPLAMCCRPVRRWWIC